MAEVEDEVAGSLENWLEIRVLGPIEISWQGRPIEIGGFRARALLARLLVDRELTVPVDRLIDAFWSDQKQDVAEKALRTMVSRVRKRLRDAGVVPDLIETRALGYVLRVDAGVTDVAQFEELVIAGRRQLTDRQPYEAIKSLEAAESLWRGTAYGEVADEPFVRAEARRLMEMRLTALEVRFDAELTVGRHREIIGELGNLTDANPMREQLWSQRMLALYRAGRQAEALRVFQELRQTLVAELGIEPGHDAQWLEQAILEQNPDLDWISPEPDEARSDSPTVPNTRTTASVQSDEHLLGREAELDAMKSWWRAVEQGESRLLMLEGDAGIGKTCLAAELARHAERSGALVLRGRCDEDPIAPFQPFSEALGRYFQSLSADEISQMPDWRLTELSRLVLRLSEYAPPRSIDLTDPEQDRFRFFGAVTETLHEAAHRGPVLLVLDDLHWANQPTVLLLRHLLRDGDPIRLGIVSLYRAADVDADHPLQAVLADRRTDHTVVRIDVKGLSADAVEKLVESAPFGDTALAEQLFQLTDGNPLFLDELLRQLSYEAATSTITSGPAKLTLSSGTPEAVKELVSRRVSRLPEDVIRFLHAAAVAGPECDATVVAVVADLSPEQRIDAVDRAVDSRLLRRVGDSGERYGFSHALVRDAIYGQLPRGRRVRLHHQIALVTERAHLHAIDAHINELAHHFYMGAALGDADKAAVYS
ncbi:MAG TPA: BTAD domain-containing putative transcriptional regulator, partial [Acidimicrobiales bacterium]